jgi:PAS domain S-box-containing protein
MIQITGYTVNAQLYESVRTLVCRARRTQDDQPVILKILKSEYPTPTELARYQQEYDLTSRLDGEGVIHPSSLEKYHNGLLIAFEDISGESLKTLMYTRSFTLTECVTIVVKIARALKNIHAANIIHHDLNPSNIVYNPDTSQLQVIDFGMASVWSREIPTGEQPNVLEGTLPYISPEQTGRVNRSVDYRTDYYAFGVTLYEMLTGRLPFEDSDPLELVHAHIAKRPVPPQVLVPTIPPVLSTIVMKLLEKNPGDRYQSAAGLQADLETCAGRLKETGKIEDFPLGEHDLSGILRIPEKLYGREQEFARLLSRFVRSASGNKELVLCPGAPGIGKSALIQALRKPVTEQRGLFLTGKHDLFKRNIPYAGIAQAFQGLARQLLTESETRLREWKMTILHVVGNNGQVIIDVIPEIALIIGKQPELQPLPPTETQNRFHLVFQNFVNVFANADHPLVLFLDDLQWIDPASLRLLDALLSNPELTHVLFIGAYRDTEVDAGHALTLLLNKLAQEGLTWETVRPEPLTKDHLRQMLSETLRCDVQASDTLATLIQTKTAGNPFFTVELLKMLYDDRLITFGGEWTWNVAQIAQAGITDSVVELMTGKLTRLPSQTWQVLKIAACLGFAFSLKTLADVSSRLEEEILADLQEALDKGLLIISDETVKFVHDKVHEAAYSQVAEQERQALHYHIGHTLLTTSAHQPQDEHIFSIADQLNQAVTLLNETEKRQLAELNLKAGQHAKNAVAYQAAFTYFQRGAALLPDDTWERCYDLTYTLYIAQAEAAYLSTLFDEAEALFGIILRQARTTLDQARVYEMQMPFYVSQTKLSEAFDIGMKALTLLGIALPKEPTQAAMLDEFSQLQNVLGGRAIADLADLPVITDPVVLAAMRCFLHLTNTTFIAFPAWFPIISVRMLKFSVEYGHCALSPFAYNNYAILLLAGMGDLERASQFAQLGVELLEHFRPNQTTCRTVLGYGNLIHHWKHPARESLTYIEQAVQLGLETGELLFTSYAIYSYGFMRLLTEEPLNVVFTTFERWQPVQYKIKQTDSWQVFLLFKQTVRNLLGDAEDLRRFVSAEFHEDPYITAMTAGNNLQGLFYLWHDHLLVAYLLGDFADALEYARRAKAYVNAIPSFFMNTTYNFFFSLALLSMYAESSKPEQEDYLKQVQTNQEQMKRWMTWCPENYAHRYWLVEAELARLADQVQEAMDAYDKAIQGAIDNDYLLGAALGNELAAKFWLQHGKTKIARAYMTEAYYYYQRWGCAPKVHDLEAYYPELVTEAISKPMQWPTTPTTLRPSIDLDLTSIVKASQAISGEIVLPELLRKLIYIVVENAGAEKGVLISRQGDKLVVEAWYARGQGEVLPEPIPIDNYPEVSSAIVYYVSRTGEQVVLNNAVKEGMFTHDAYVMTQKPQSILCLPILRHSDLTGILYLENNQTPGAFTPDRMEILALLASQAAISLENARFYKKVEDSEQKYRSLYENAVEGIFQTTPDGRLITANPAMVRMAGFDSAQELIAAVTNLATEAYINPDDRATFLRLLGEAGQVIGFETQLYRKDKTPKDKTPFWVAVSARSVRDEQGNVLYFEGSLVDITARKQTEEAERKRQLAEDANRAKSTFLANMSHELRTPLNAILGFAQLMARNPQIPAEEQDNLSIIQRSGEHLLTLINNVLDLSKIEAGRMLVNKTNVDLYQLLDDIANMFRLRAEEKHLRLLLERAPDLPGCIKADEVKLRQVLINLLGNAIKFTKEGTVSVRVFELHELKNGDTSQTPKLINSQTHTLRFEIEDTGSGIASEDLDNLFEAFVQTKTGRTKPEGTGLGLPLSRKLVQLMGGDLRVKSEVGCGTTVTFEICVRSITGAGVTRQRSTRRAIALEPGQPRYRLLIVDDQADNRAVLVKLLSLFDFALREAENGQEAIEIWDQWQPHLIWLDLRMPMLDGYEATKRIRNEELSMKNKNLSELVTHNSQLVTPTVIIAVTAASFEEERAKVFAAGCDDVISKPFHEREVFDSLHKHLGVRFVYEEGEGQTMKGEGQRVEEVLTPAALAALPQEMLRLLEQATLTTDIMKIVAIVEQIRGQYPALADALMKLADNFEYHTMLALIQKADINCS